MQRLLKEWALTEILTGELFSKTNLIDLRQVGRLALTSSTSLTLLLRIRSRFTAAFSDQVARVRAHGLAKEAFETFWSLSLVEMHSMMISPCCYTMRKGRRLAIAGTNAKLEASARKASARKACYNLAESFKRSSSGYGYVGNLCEFLRQEGQNIRRVDAPSTPLACLSEHSPRAMQAVIEDLLIPRLRASHWDALHCYFFVRMLEAWRAFGFQMLDFYNRWTAALQLLLSDCTNHEAACLGVFTRESMSHIATLISDKNLCRQIMHGNPCWDRNYYKFQAATGCESVTHADLAKGQAKWEGRLTIGVLNSLRSENFNARHRSLIFLDECSGAFPSIPKYARKLLPHVESIKDADLIMLAKAVAAKIMASADVIKVATSNQ